ncbi:phosphoribosylanthranilate isomerase [Candidatus Pelagibacter sp.]|nr:phosphoribosylanthranilate isomerase [Candidatus Pelagibacter sp.]
MIKGIKICGVSDLETLNFILNHEHPAKFIGFISNYKKSKRFVDHENLIKLLNTNKKNTNFVSVLVNPSDKELEKIKDLNFDYYQLYDVSPERTKNIKEKYNIKIISAFTIANQIDVEKYKNYTGISDIFLFDGKGYEKSLGFDHELLNSLPNSINKMIAGNIKIDDIPTFKNKDFFIDLSGSLENEEGKKDIEKINKLLNLTIL